jgi:hypothetical protein
MWILVILVVLVFFSIVTSIVVSFLLNVVNSIRFPTHLGGRPVGFSMSERVKQGKVLFPFFTLSDIQEKKIQIENKK